MLHALNNKKARLDRIIKGVAKQPREDLITSTLFGSIEFMAEASRVEALRALLGLDLGAASRMTMWPKFYHGSQRVEPDLVIVDGQECHIVEVKWGAHLGIRQLERQLDAVGRWDCRKQDRDLLGPVPRKVKTLTVLGFERHHSAQVAACVRNAGPIRQRTWQEVARDMWDLQLRSKDDALVAWAQQVHQFLTNTPKARTMTGWPELRSVDPGRLEFNVIRPLDLVPVPAAAWTFPSGKNFPTGKGTAMSDKIIWQSARNIIDTVNSLEALGDVIGRSIMQKFQGDHVVDDGQEGQNENGWIEPMMVRDFILRGNARANARVTRWISIGFQLTSDASELEWSHGQRAKLLVGSNNEGFAFGTDFPNAGGEAEDMADDERYNSDGFRWIGEKSGGWFFAVPLDALGNEADVQRLVVNPLHRLIARNDSSQDALGPIKDDLCLPPQHQELSAEAS